MWTLRGGDPWDDAFAGWRRLQHRDVHPAVVVVNAPLESVRGQGVGDASRLLESLELLDHFEPPELWLETPVPSEWVVGVLTGQRRIYWQELAVLLGEDPQDLRDLVEAGRLPPFERPDHVLSASFRATRRQFPAPPADVP